MASSDASPGRRLTTCRVCDADKLVMPDARPSLGALRGLWRGADNNPRLPLTLAVSLVPDDAGVTALRSALRVDHAPQIGKRARRMHATANRPSAIAADEFVRDSHRARLWRLPRSGPIAKVYGRAVLNRPTFLSPRSMCLRASRRLARSARHVVLDNAWQRQFDQFWRAWGRAPYTARPCACASIGARPRSRPSRRPRRAMTSLLDCSPMAVVRTAELTDGGSTLADRAASAPPIPTFISEWFDDVDRHGLHKHVWSTTRSCCGASESLAPKPGLIRSMNSRPPRSTFHGRNLALGSGESPCLPMIPSLRRRHDYPFFCTVRDFERS